MKSVLISLIGISVLQSILLLSVKEGASEKVIRMIGGAAMTAVLISGIVSFDYQAYAAALQREQYEIHWDEESLRREVNALHRRYIEAQCSAYILEKASQLQIGLSSASVTLAWNSEGYWYPIHAEMLVSETDADFMPLKRLIESELGIPDEEQIWREDDNPHGSF